VEQHVMTRRPRVQGHHHNILPIRLGFLHLVYVTGKIFEWILACRTVAAVTIRTGGRTFDYRTFDYRTFDYRTFDYRTFDD
jgi:hypothetical protein